MVAASAVAPVKSEENSLKPTLSSLNAHQNLNSLTVPLNVDFPPQPMLQLESSVSMEEGSVRNLYSGYCFLLRLFFIHFLMSKTQMVIVLCNLPFNNLLASLY